MQGFLEKTKGFFEGSQGNLKIRESEVDAKGPLWGFDRGGWEKKQFREPTENGRGAVPARLSALSADQAVSEIGGAKSTPVVDEDHHSLRCFDGKVSFL